MIDRAAIGQIEAVTGIEQPGQRAAHDGGPRPNAPAGVTVVRVVIAGEYDMYDGVAQDLFWRSDWKVTPQSNRYGYRLQGPAVMPISPVEKRSHGIVPGVVQIPPNGQPIIQMRDAQTSGGYPKIATVIEADLWRIGQAGLGGKLRFEQTLYPDALAAQDEVSAYLDKLRVNVRRLEELRRCR